MKVETVLETARAQIGYKEGSNNNNKYGKEYGLNNQPWCVIFLWWCFKHSLDGQIEKLSDFMPNSAHCNGVRSFALNIDRWYPRSEIGLHVEPEPGDLVIFDWGGDGSGDHIGIIETVTNRNAFTTIEGNASDAVRRVERSLTNVIGLYKPLYDFDFRAAEQQLIYINNAQDEQIKPADEVIKKPEVPQVDDGEVVLKPGDISKAVSILQYALHMRGYEPAGSRKKNGDYDGEFGEGTQTAVKHFQKDHDFPVTGNVTLDLLLLMWEGVN